MKGYEVTPYTVRPFYDNELRSGAERRQRTQFNQTHARARIVIEHVFGLLKGRFPALKLLPGRDIPCMYRVIQALRVLHNILLMIGDNAEEIPDFNGGDADAEGAQVELDNHIYDAPDPVRLFGQQVLQAQETVDLLRREGRRLRRDILNNIV